MSTNTDHVYESTTRNQAVDAKKLFMDGPTPFKVKTPPVTVQAVPTTPSASVSVVAASTQTGSELGLLHASKVVPADTEYDLFYCDCEIEYHGYTWKKSSEYEPCESGISFKEYYNLFREGNHVFSYDHGLKPSIFPYLCGEVVSRIPLSQSFELSSAQNDMYIWVQTVSNAERYLQVSANHDKIHNKNMGPATLSLDKCLAVVCRPFKESLHVQILPTLFSRNKLLMGMPVFDRKTNGLCALVGNQITEFCYVLNCAAAIGCDIGLPLDKGKIDSNTRATVAFAVDDNTSLISADVSSLKRILQRCTVTSEATVNSKYVLNTDSYSPLDGKANKHKAKLLKIYIILMNSKSSLHVFVTNDGGESALFRWSVNAPKGSWFELSPPPRSPHSSSAVHSRKIKSRAKRYGSHDMLI